MADRHAREEVRQRTLMQQKLAEKEKANKEENLRMLAKRAREGQSAGASATARKPPTGAGLKTALGGYGSESDSRSGSGSEASDHDDSDDDEAAKLRDKLRREKRQDRERELRMNNMGTEQRVKQLARYASYLFLHGSQVDQRVQASQSRHLREGGFGTGETYALERFDARLTVVQP